MSVLQMTVEAYDTAFPTQRVREDVYIEVIRNPNNPIFRENFYTRTVAENVPLGTFVLCVNATDQDVGDILSYEIIAVQNPINPPNQVATDFFYMTTGGCIYVQRNLYESINDQYSFTVRARDHAYPEKFGQATVQIIIKRDQFTPQCDQSDYSVTIQETSAVNSTQPIITVRATDGDLEASWINLFIALTDKDDL